MSIEAIALVIYLVCETKQDQIECFDFMVNCAYEEKKEKEHKLDECADRFNKGEKYVELERNF